MEAPGKPTLVKPVRIGRLSGDEGGATGSAALLTVVIGEQRTFLRDAVDIRRVIAGHPSAVGAEIGDAHVVGHDHFNSWKF